MAYESQYKNYLAPIPYLVNHYIREYDISKANLNIFYYKGIITKEEYDLILTFPKQQREIYFGYMQKDKEKAELLSEGLAEFRQRFIEENNIPDYSILSVKSDAIYLIDVIPSITKFDNVEFMLKNTYTSFFNVNKLEIYYGLDPINNIEHLDIKGINDEKLLLHQDYMIQFLCSIFYSIQTNLVGNTLEIINDFSQKYCNRELPIGFYRELNADSMFRFSRQDGSQFLCDPVGETMIPFINIITNYNVIRELYGIVSTIHFNKN